MILRSRAEDFCIGQYWFSYLPKPLHTRRGTNFGNDGLGPEGGNSLLHITVIMTAMFSGKRLSCEAVFRLPLIHDPRSSMVSLWRTVNSPKTHPREL